MPREVTIRVHDPPPPPDGCVLTGFDVYERGGSYPRGDHFPRLESAVDYWLLNGTERTGLSAVAEDFDFGTGETLTFLCRFHLATGRWGEWKPE